VVFQTEETGGGGQGGLMGRGGPSYKIQLPKLGLIREGSFRAFTIAGAGPQGECPRECCLTVFYISLGYL